MKKLNLRFLIILCLVLLNVGFASSQIRFGVRGGFDVSDNRVNKDILNTSNRLGPQIGGVLEVMAPIVGWGAETGIIYGMQQFKIEEKNKDLKDYHCLRVPLNLKKKFSVAGLFGVFLVAGPYAEFKLSGGDLYNDGNLVKQYKSKSFGMGLNAGGGVEILSHLEIGMYYRKALTNEYSGEASDLVGEVLKKKPSNWAVNLTYFF